MGLMKKLTSAVVASSLVLSLVGSASATSPDKIQAAYSRMAELNLAKGTENGPDLNALLTRAQLVTILVRSFGRSDVAALAKGAPSFSDVSASHWASGEIAVGKALMESAGQGTIGYTDGSFKPDRQVTAGEALAFLMKFIGVKRNATLSWPMDYLQGAVDAGMITNADATFLQGQLNTNATRGIAFYLSDQIFYNYKMPSTGKTVYTTYVAPNKPSLSVDSVAATTTDASITVSGTVSTGAQVFVGTASNAVTVSAGKFSATVPLAMGANSIAVAAVDIAGNTTEATVSVTRTVGVAAKIEAADVTVAAGEKATVSAVVKDAKGNTIANAVVTGESTLGSLDGSTFTAGATTGTGTLSLKSGGATATVNVTVTAGALASVTADKASYGVGEKVTLTAKDANGNAVEGVTYSTSSADLVGANGVYAGTKAGSYTITATKGSASATVTVGVYGKVYALKVLSAPDSITANESTKKTVTVGVIDENGNLVGNSKENVVLSGTGINKAYKSDDTELTAPFTVAAKNGVATFQINAAAAAAGTVIKLTAAPGTPANFEATSPNGTKNVSANAQVATSLKVTAPEFLPNAKAPTADNLLVTALDQEGKAMLAASGSWNVKLSVTGPAWLDAAKTKTSINTVNADPVAEYTLYPSTGLTGDVTITATIDGLGTKTAVSKNVFNTTAAGFKVTTKDDKTSATVGTTSDADLQVTVQLVDTNGVPIDTPAGFGTITVDPGKDSDDVARNLTTYTTADVAGVLDETLGAANLTLDASGKATFTIRNTLAHTLTLKFTKTDYSSAQTALTWNAGAVVNVALTRNATTLSVPVSEPQITLKAQVYDVYNNKAAKADIGVTFTATKGGNATDEVTVDGTAKKAVVKTDANGVATATIVTRPFTDATYLITVSGTTDLALTATVAGVSDNVTLAPSSRVATTVEVTVHSAALGNVVNTATAGDTVFVRAVVKDQYGGKMEDQAAKLALANAVKSLWDGTALTKGTATFAWHAAGSYYRIDNAGAEGTVTLGKAGLQTLTVKNTSGQTEVLGNANIVVNADKTVATMKAKVNEVSSGKLAVTKGTVAGPFTLQLTDKYGNSISLNASQDIYLTVAGLSFRTSVDGVNVDKVGTTGSATFYVVSPNTVTDYNLVVSTTAGGADIGGGIVVTAK